MTETSDRLSLPLLVAGQAQKEIWHNEALMLLDMLVQPVVEAVGTITPPPAPLPGQCWIIGSSPTGDWVGKANNLTVWTSDGWRFAAPRIGMTCWSLADGVTVRATATSWGVGEVDAHQIRIGGDKVLGARQAAIANPSGGTTIDVEARLAINALLDALRSHGAIFS